MKVREIKQMHFELGVSYISLLLNFCLHPSFTCKEISYLLIIIWNYVFFLGYEIELPQKSE